MKKSLKAFLIKAGSSENEHKPNSACNQTSEEGKNVVVMDLEEYNAIQETMHLTSTQANRTRLHSALDEMESGKHSKHKLIEK